MREIVFILEPDTGRVTVESSQADAKIAKEISKDLGQGSVINCARPKLEIENSSVNTVAEQSNRFARRINLSLSNLSSFDG